MVGRARRNRNTPSFPCGPTAQARPHGRRPRLQINGEVSDAWRTSSVAEVSQRCLSRGRSRSTKRIRSACPFAHEAPPTASTARPTCQDGRRTARLTSSRAKILIGLQSRIQANAKRSHAPEESVGDYLDFHGWSRADLAEPSDLPIDETEAICSGSGKLSPRSATAFETAFNRPAHLWLHLQRQFDQATARRGRTSSMFPQARGPSKFLARKRGNGYPRYAKDVLRPTLGTRRQSSSTVRFSADCLD